MRSPTSSMKKIKAELLRRGRKVGHMTVSRRLSKEFNLKSYKPAKKPRLTPTMKAKRLQFANNHQRWTAQEWQNVLFSDESTFQQFAVRKSYVRRPPGKRFDDRYTISSMKHPPSQMVWGAMCRNGVAAQWRIQKILVGGNFKHKTSKIRMSSTKLRLIFRSNVFSPKIRWSPKKKKGLHQN